MAWEVDWAHPENTGHRVWARNPTAHKRTAREWHWVATGYLRTRGVSTPTYRKDSWQVDWSRRNGKLVWGRNPESKMPSARKWHWVDFGTLANAGVKWQPKTEKTGRYVNSRGYVCLTRRGMTAAEVDLAESHGLFKGARKTFVYEHQLVAVKKYGRIPRGSVVRHLNGVKDDNAPENLALGTSAENNMDHETARLAAISWRERYEDLERQLRELKEETG